MFKRAMSDVNFLPGRRSSYSDFFFSQRDFGAGFFQGQFTGTGNSAGAPALRL
jgi:hypothetical protein